MHLRDGSYGLIEVKIGGAMLIDDGRKKLSRLANEIDTKKMREPAFRMIVVAEGDYAYEEPDGTLICPIGCLKPFQLRVQGAGRQAGIRARAGQHDA